jgi:3-methyladenine DNA glycosylase AlkD
MSARKKTTSTPGNELAQAIERELRENGRPERARQEKRYLKSALTHLGVSVPTTRKVVLLAVRKSGPLPRGELFNAVDALWARGIHELRMAAMELLVSHTALLTAADIVRLERLLRQARTWALVDVLAASVVGSLVERFAQLGRTLDRWSKDEDFWLRRSALLALMGPLRRGQGDFARFGRYADAMLDQKEFFIRKAIGWVLRETSKQRPSLVYRWLLPRAARASGVTLREAWKYLPSQQREQLQVRAKPKRARGARDAGVRPRTTQAG